MKQTLYSRLAERYRETGRVTQRKARLLFSVNLFLVVTVSLLAAAYVAQGLAPFRVATLVVLIAVFFGSDTLVYRGRLGAGAMLHVYSLLVILTMYRFLVGTSLYELQSHTVLMAILVFDAAMVHTDRRTLTVTVALTGLSVVAVFLLAPVVRPEVFAFGEIIGPTILAMLLTAIAGAIAFALYSLSAGIVDDLETTHSRLERQYVSLNELFHGFRRGMEIGESLAEAGEEASRSVKALQSQTDEHSRVLSTLEETTARISQQSDALKHASASLEERMTSQSASVEQATAAVEQINGSIHSMSKLSEERSAQVERLVGIAGDGAAQMRRSEEALNTVVQSSNTMLESVHMIGKISAQSNLLAMNAAIEAAHAGRYGTGFAVVADEIRKLAVTSADYAKQIAETIKKGAADIDGAKEINVRAANLFSRMYDEIGTTNGAFREIIAGFGELTKGSQEILGAVTLLRETTTQIATASREGRTLSEDGRTATATLSEVTRRLSSLSSENSGAVDRLVAAVRSVEEVSAQNRTQLGELDREIQEIYEG